MILTSPGDSALMTAVRPRVVLKYLGQILLLMAALTAVPLAVSLVVGKDPMSLRLLAVAAALVVLALPLSRLPAPRQIQWNEALAVTGLTFVVASLAMTWPLMGHGIPALDAWFEAVSGITTTGLTTLGSVEGLPRLFLFSRAWMQWYGGLGIAALSVALLMRHHVTSRRLLSSGGEEAAVETATTHARRVFAVYLALTVLGLLLVWPLTGDFFTALVHVLAAVSTGGFSSSDHSLAALAPGARGALIGLSLAGAVGLPLYWHAVREGHWPTLTHDPEARALLIAVVAAALVLALLLHGSGMPWTQAAGHALLMGASAQSTTGFASLDVAALDPAAKLVLILSMAVGGCTGSTAGGVKLIRVLILLRLIELTLRRTAAPPRAVMSARIAGRRLEPDPIVNAMVLLGLWLLVVLASWLVFLLHGQAPLDSLFEVVSATGTVGLTTGIAGPDLAPLLKLVLGADMLFGRVEVIALLVVLYPPTWIGRRRTIP